MKNIMIQGITMDEFQEKMQEIVRKEFSLLHPLKKENHQLLTREETAEYLDVSSMTLHNWAKLNILNPYKIGSRVYYKKSDIEDAMIPLTVKTKKL